jgi:hypothetical protein
MRGGDPTIADRKWFPAFKFRKPRLRVYYTTWLGRIPGDFSAPVSREDVSNAHACRKLTRIASLFRKSRINLQVWRWQA